MLQEFREFVARGNAFDLAVGISMGTVFGAIVSSLVTDIVLPPIGLMNTVPNFLIIAFVIFMLVRTVGATRCAHCTSELRAT